MSGSAQARDEAAAEPSPVALTADHSRLRFAAKTALSLTLAYLLPMALGWPQPQTAAITVMLIAATGSVAESLQKGVLRVLGTLMGAAVGLTLIALFPQDRLIYLFAVSVVAAVFFYLYSAYQGDSTLFMLAAVVTLMVFNGGDAEGAFLYGVDRTFMTIIGVLTYTVVGSMLWPVQLADNTRRLGAGVVDQYQRAFEYLATAHTGDTAIADQLLTELLAAEEAFQANYAAVRGDSERVKAFLPEWQAITGSYQRLDALLLPALRNSEIRQPDCARHLDNYEAMVQRTGDLFARVKASWQGRPGGTPPPVETARYNTRQTDDASQLSLAAVAARAVALEKIQTELIQLCGAIDSLVSDQGEFVHQSPPDSEPAFIWLDRESLKTGLRAFVTFWLATAIWIQFNPPGGFMFVTLCTVLIPLVSYTPVTPKLLVILFSLGFVCAIPAYIFILPQMTHWLQLGLFLFAYAFLGFAVFPGPVAIFFLLGLFTLGIQNEMHYDMGILLPVMLMFYMVCTLLIISVNFPFSSKPERLYRSFRQRFLANSSRLLARGPSSTATRQWANRIDLITGGVLVSKLQIWGARVDSTYFSANEQRSITAFNQACEVLQGQLKVLLGSTQGFAYNQHISEIRRQFGPSKLSALCQMLAHTSNPAQLEQAFAGVEKQVLTAEQRLTGMVNAADLDSDQRDALAELYTFINLQVAILHSIQQCRRKLQDLDWLQLADSRF